ncbi:T9SS type B sorting domain-containing protein [Maribacter sp. 2210JD10-5]|uniref:T9SS type B sorting domain-containing protein n=1 Tax=Maribacter sp. 2210JD10-5 TaxID=3386272 RepID=UPI0039BD70B0
MSQKKLLLFFFLIFGITLNAQLSDLHYLPPLKQGQNNQGIREQAVYLSTPEPTTFTVNAYRGTNTTPVATFNISNVAPAVYTMSNGDNNIILVNNANTGVVLNNSGLRFESPSGNRFYVNYRGSSNAQSASLTSKGRVAMGTRFKWGGVPNRGSHPSKSNTLGIMATEDNTTIDFFGYDPGCEFRVGNNRAGITANTHQITLNANESFVYETYIGNSPTQAHEDGWIGASIVSDKNIVISNGSMNFGRQVGASNRDAGIDQPVPENRLGKEYVFVRGNGNANGWTEFPLLIATSDNTQIFVNGSATPIATLNNGEYFEIPSSFYSSNTVGANMLVQTSKDAYAYQCLAGASTPYTQGLNFVAPVNCLLPDVMDNIPDIQNMAGTPVTGGLTIIAAVNTPDANIQVTDGNGPVSLPAANAVAGSSDWKTFYIPNLNGDVSVQSTGPMAIGFFGFNGARGVAGYFSGFDTVPEVKLEIRGGTGCFVGSEIFEATGNFDAYQWFEDGVLIPGANSPSYAPSGAGEFFVRGTKGPCTYDSQSIQALYCNPDIVLDKTVDKAEITEGETATFTIRVRNLGVGPVTNLQITDNIPDGLTLVSDFTIKGTWSGNTWDIGTLNGGEVAELELEVQADEIDTLPLLSLINTVTNTQDQLDSNTTPDNPSAYITVHNDLDNDGVRDVTDLDDDNDGVYDRDECPDLTFNLNSGNSNTTAIIGAENYLIVDIFSLDNSFNLELNGTDIAGEIQFQPGISGNLATFSDGYSYGENGNAQIYTLTGSPETPLLRVVMDQGGQLTLYGAKTSNGPLEPITLSTAATPFSWNAPGNNIIRIGQTVNGSTNISGVLHTAGCDTDSDGTPDQLDLDSDGDGCSDANEFYKDNNADGGDGGEYGIGVPVVNTTNGTVNTASYTRVFAPEIVLGNTSEDLGGTDINGQNVSLGQTLNYVLRFQNTGDDNATNYSIRNVLPNNVTVDNIDTSSVPLSTANHDVANGIITFAIDDSYVQVGDPEYKVIITVTIDRNCSSFISACSSTLENNAFSTYQGVINTATFTDEGGSTSITACPRTPNVANNSILNDLTSCNEARTVQLCGEDTILAAGSGFSSYNWVLDTNANGTVDGGDTVLNDGDPDNDPSTLAITNIGDYIVEKSSGGSCPDLIERIKVERFGTTQTNPIISYFNQVNNDANTGNDIQGEIVTCSIDADLLPKIFLCGAADEALIQLGITDAQSITWEKLNEASCSDTSDDCANKNATCKWTNVGNGNNFTATESGEFRVIINYLNGCFSRFYFNVFKNDVELDGPPPTDILCNTPGNIRITSIGTGYGFQLIDATNNNIVVPFSDNNGPNFDIATSGTYIVQAVQLDPMDGTPISGACIFETDPIGIQERIFDVNIGITSADCNDLGEISISALNARPNYSYEIFLSDGLGGFSDAGKQLAVNSNTHTFTNVVPGDYRVITSTQDGCSITSDITVSEIPTLKLNAVTSENITCTPGIVNLTPSGGAPNPNYEMAIWSKDGAMLYADEASVPDSAYQTNTNFLFGDLGNPNREGNYVFIVRDGSGCYGTSNTVTVTDLGMLSISASNTDIICADSSTATLTVSVNGGTAPYQYSLDGGSNYQNINTFENLPAGLYTITVMDSSGTTGTGCVENFDYEIVQPFRLTASAAIIEDASCNPAGALVKIINPNGGQAPYEYRFDGSSSFTGTDTQNLLPGNHRLEVKDALGCTFEMDLTVPTPTPDPSFSQDITYDCTGFGTVTITPSNSTDFDYSYAINGTPNSPETNNVFAGLADNTYTITAGFSNVSPQRSILFFEGFGAGHTTQIGEIGPGYCYEPQDGSTTSCNLGPSGILVDGEYAVTNFVTNPIPAYRNPDDHTALTNGRFFAINPSNNLVGNNSIIWERTNIEVLPNTDITISFWAYNLRQTGSAGNNPEVEIQLVDGSGNIISSNVTAEIPKNNNTSDWHLRTVTFNPLANTNVTIVLRSNQPSDDGNELILDDIEAYQLLEICKKTTDISVIVEDNKAFSSALLSVNNPSCNGVADGSIRFEVSNFDVTTGFQYSTDGTTWTTAFASPITTSATLADGTYNIQVRRVNDNTCSVNFSATLTAPDAVVASASLSQILTCSNDATITASAMGGTPNYRYQLEDNLGNNISGYDFTTNGNNTIFSGITTAGDYYVRVRDDKGCEDIIDTPITITAPANIVFDLTPTPCYSGTNDASILVDVTAGNGNYEFRINTNGVWSAWTAPTPSTAVTHTFSGLSDGSYDIEVRDQLGCPVTSNAQTVIVQPQLVANVAIVEPSSCGDGSITVNATGGNGTLLYAIVPANTSPSGLYSTTNNLVITNAMATANPSGFDVYVQDNNGAPAICTFIQEDIILSPATALTVGATANDPECFDGLGSIDVTVGGGTAPYSYTLIDLSATDGIDYGRSDTNVSGNTLTFNGIGVGNYEVTITDENTCSETSSIVTINNAIEITADIDPEIPNDCSDTPADYGFNFINVVTPTGAVRYSLDGGLSWQNSHEMRGRTSGTEVFPSIEVTLPSGTICQKDFDRFIIPFPVDDLDISLFPQVLNCNDLQVTVQGQEGDTAAGYRYTYTDDVANFDGSMAIWTANIPHGTSHTFANIDPTTPQQPGLPLLVPGRTYVFYVENDGCVRSSSVNVNDIPSVNIPIEFTTDVTPTCSGATTGAITFTITPDTAYPNMNWEIYQVGNNTPIQTSGGNVTFNATVSTTVPLGEGDYYIEVTQVEADNVTEACKGASENTYVPELAPLSGTAVVTRNISCNLPGLISINGISGGGGAPYSYDVTGTHPTDLDAFGNPVVVYTATGTTDNPVQIPVNSPAGNYTVTLYDQYSCPLVLNSVAMTLSPNPTLTVAQDNCSAPITVTATGNSAVGNLRYAKVPHGNPVPTAFEDNAGIFQDVPPGSYDIYVIDGKGCTEVETNFVVHPVLSATATLTKLLDCTASPDATINIQILDGSANYQYGITNNAGVTPVAPTNVPSTNFDYHPTAAGEYTVTIYDTNTPNNASCNREFTINVPPMVTPIIDTITGMDVTCSGNADGTITISMANNAAAPYVFEITSLDGSSTNISPSSTTTTSATFTGLAPTTGVGYVVTVTGDATTNNCSINSAPITISEPNPIVIGAPTVVAFGCSSGNTSNNAMITISSVSGGSNSFNRYRFFRTDDPITTSIVEPNVDVQDNSSNNYIEADFAGGYYGIQVYDNTGCSEIVYARILPFDELGTPSIHIDNPISCSNLGEGISIDIVSSQTSLTANPTNYQFRKLPSTTYQNSSIFSGLQPGTYTFGVKNIDTNCEVMVSHVVEEPNTFDVTTEVLANVVCHGDNGSVRFNISDATYASDFTLNIYDTKGTLATDTDDTLEYADLAVSLGQTAPVVLPAGNYRVEVIQNNFPNCPQERAFSITGPDAPITLDTIDVTHAGCGAPQGTAIVRPLGGEGPYDITIINTDTGTTHPVINNVNSNLFQELSAGLFTVNITDALGCNRTFPNAFEILQPDPIAGAIVSNNSLECEGDNDAEIEFVLNSSPSRNVVTNYRYTLRKYNDVSKTVLLQSSASQTSSIFSNLETGFYTIFVEDDLKCTFENTAPFEIIDPSEVNGTLTIAQPLSCLVNAELQLSAMGGTAPYLWSVDGVSFNAMNGLNGTNTHVFQNVSAGKYQYFIKDSFDCVSIISNEITINAIEPLTLDFDGGASVNCNGDDSAVVIANADGGLGDYMYGLFSDAALTSVLRPYQSSNTFDNLGQGLYYVGLQSGDCETSREIRIEEPEPLLITPHPTNVSCRGADDGSIVIDVTGGSGMYQFAISPNLNQFDDVNMFDELAPGDYQVIAQDSNGCFELIEFTITQPEELQMTYVSTPEICEGDEDGSITLNIIGGTAPYRTSINSNEESDFEEGKFIYDNLASGTYIVFTRDAMGCEIFETIEIESGANLNATAEVIYECSGATPENRLVQTFEDPSVTENILYALDTDDANDMVLDPDFSNLNPGAHFVTIAHANGCVYRIDFMVEEFLPLELSAVQQNINEITALATGGREQYTYYFNDVDNGNDNTFYITETDTYTVRVVDENGCESVSSIFMEFIDIEIPNFFTPDGDGNNDMWIPKNIEQFPNIFIKVFDRTGRQVYKLPDNVEGWDGLYNDTNLPSGDYWYIIKLYGENDKREFVGHFTLYR